ncbi:MAG: ATP-binding domain-containing protein, partial [Defluviitaleaceae bacterium]|nr:ATP-binding domain-containing protein [Defluviitaleaceae bacterium]
VVEIIQKLPDQFNTVGILLSSTKAAKQFYSVLKDMYTKRPDTDNRHLTLIADRDDSFAPGIMVMPAHFAKGLEFDAVICPEYGSLTDQRLLYLICTRALHQLYLLRSTGV